MPENEKYVHTSKRKSFHILRYIYYLPAIVCLSISEMRQSPVTVLYVADLKKSGQQKINHVWNDEKINFFKTQTKLIKNNSFSYFLGKRKVQIRSLIYEKYIFHIFWVLLILPSSNECIYQSSVINHKRANLTYVINVVNFVLLSIYDFVLIISINN